MSTYSRQFLSAKVSGLFIPIDVASSPGRLIHAASVAGAIDELYLYLSNVHTVPVAYTIEWGGATSGFTSKGTVPAQEGFFEVIPGFPMLSGVTVNCWAATSGVLVAHGYINRAL